eukprot:m.150754 g.150754  ORF g.150754 m.150754 type:complete len:75 (-) comp14237_c0_seq4:477-701(-)
MSVRSSCYHKINGTQVTTTAKLYLTRVAFVLRMLLSQGIAGSVNESLAVFQKDQSKTCGTGQRVPHLMKKFDEN